MSCRSGGFASSAIIEGAAGLLIFGCVISKLVSRRQEELTEEIHQTTFEDRLDRVRTNLHLVFTDIGSVQQLQAEQGVLPELVLRRLESTVRVFRGELRAVHDLLYRCRVMPDEETMALAAGQFDHLPSEFDRYRQCFAEPVGELERGTQVHCQPRQ